MTDYETMDPEIYNPLTAPTATGTLADVVSLFVSLCLQFASLCVSVVILCLLEDILSLLLVFLCPFVISLCVCWHVVSLTSSLFVVSSCLFDDVLCLWSFCIFYSVS